MEKIVSKEILHKKIKEHKKKGKTISLVPTMGNLHDGHIFIVKKAREESDIVIVSIFVNPIQFGKGEDYKIYPRTIDKDLDKLKNICDYVFVPKEEDVYEKSSKDINVAEDNIAKTLCGKFRKTHFKGVLKIVLKLFNICIPDFAYFGLKDYQQYFLIKKMTKEFNLNIDIKPVSIYRDKDGLATSSRNSYLDKEQRKKALKISESLNLIKDKIKSSNEKSAEKLKKIVLSKLIPNLDVQYIEAVNKTNFEKTKTVDSNTLFLISCFCDNVRLIDNLEV
jgi:pantoate--beta-alanine ligase